MYCVLVCYQFAALLGGLGGDSESSLSDSEQPGKIPDRSMPVHGHESQYVPDELIGVVCHMGMGTEEEEEEKRKEEKQGSKKNTREIKSQICGN